MFVAEQILLKTATYNSKSFLLKFSKIFRPVIDRNTFNCNFLEF